MTDYDHLGTSGGHIEILDYDPRWPLMYEREAERIRHACGDAIATIEHIGSTAVPGLPAKPILDIMPGGSYPCRRRAHYRAVNRAWLRI